MRDEPQNDSMLTGGGHTGLFPWFVWTIFIVILVYPLSVGPMAKLIPNPPASLRNIYAPLAYLCAELPPVRSFYDWYAKVWGVRL